MPLDLTPVRWRCQSPLPTRGLPLSCNHLLCETAGFTGAFQQRCSYCRAYTAVTLDADNGSVERRILRGRAPTLTGGTAYRCAYCRRGLLLARIEAGVLQTVCRQCKALLSFGFRARTTAPTLPASMTAEELVALMEARWDAWVQDRARRRAAVAVGLRFDVFRRDGFCCRYCGRSVNDGAILEADHVIPESKGGPTTLDNLVTACWACNSGKSDKDIDAALVAVLG